jgi:hypothetical protein
LLATPGSVKDGRHAVLLVYRNVTP